MKRYTIIERTYVDGGIYMEMAEDPDGEFIKYEDHIFELSLALEQKVCKWVDIIEVLKQCSHYLREYEEIMPLAEHEIETPFIVEDLIKTVDKLIEENEG